MKYDQICLQPDGTWAFFKDNMTVTVKLYADILTGNPAAFPIHGDITRCGEWDDLDEDELAEQGKLINEYLKNARLELHIVG